MSSAASTSANNLGGGNVGGDGQKVLLWIAGIAGLVLIFFFVLKD